MRAKWSAGLCAWALSGCATVVPQFDIPHDPQNDGKPTVADIRGEVLCELNDIVRNGRDLGHVLTVAHDIDVAILLNLDVTDDGGLAPTGTYTNGMFAFAGGFNLDQAREQNYQEEWTYSLTEIQKAQQALGPRQRPGVTEGPCGQSPVTNLSGDLGLKDAWDLALTGQTDLNWTVDKAPGAFGGTVSFTVKKQLTATGPTWTLKHFKGPGGLLTASENNVDKLTFAFVQGPQGKNKAAGQRAAADFLQSIQQGNISTSLTNIQGKVGD